MPSSRSRQADLQRLAAVPFAHRGLHGGGRIENSRAAFEAAIAAGHGIELDVQASADGDAIVFHDYELERLTGQTGKLAERTSAALQAVKLTGTRETVPTLAEVLLLIGGRVPLLIELKSPNRRVAGLCRSVAAALERYSGAVGVMSFNPQVGGWFSRHSRPTLRGLVVTESDRKGVRGRFERHLSLWRAHPDFLAYDIRDLPSRFAARVRQRGAPILTWTVRSQHDRAVAAAHADQIIYEVQP
jgi:glycerophosphoryl diester phosphodiesterase